MVHAWETSPQHHRGGVLTLRVAEMLFDPTVTHAPDFDQSTRHVAVKDALAQLAANRLVKDTYR